MLIIAIYKKYVLAPIATLGDVVRIPGEYHSC